jgi:hypothetical protein
MTAPPELAVVIDGVALPRDEARALWERFSDWMEEHRGDLAGFAAREGYASVHPDVDGGRPVLRVSRTETQQPYAAVSEQRRAKGGPTRTGGAGGSPDRHERPRRDRSPRRNSKK